VLCICNNIDEVYYNEVDFKHSFFFLKHCVLSHTFLSGIIWRKSKHDSDAASRYPDGTEMAIAGQRCSIDDGRYRSSIYFYKVKVDTTISDTMVLPASKDKEGSRERWALKKRCTSLNKRRDTSMFDISGKNVLADVVEIEKKNDMYLVINFFIKIEIS